MRTRTRTMAGTALGAVLGLGLVAVGTAAIAGGEDADGVHLEGDWVNGGHLSIELEDRNTHPLICFLWESDAPQDGDSFESHIVDRESGATVVDLGSGDQWIEGAGEGCEIPRDDRFRDVFADPGDYVVELRVIEDQGTLSQPPLRSQPLEAG